MWGGLRDYFGNWGGYEKVCGGGRLEACFSLATNILLELYALIDQQVDL